MKTHGTLDDILCDPDLADLEFDKIAKSSWHRDSRHCSTVGAPLHCGKSPKPPEFAQSFSPLSNSAQNSNRVMQLRSWNNEYDVLNSPGLYLITGSSPGKKITYTYVGKAR